MWQHEKINSIFGLGGRLRQLDTPLISLDRMQKQPGTQFTVMKGFNIIQHGIMPEFA